MTPEDVSGTLFRLPRDCHLKVIMYSRTFRALNLSPIALLCLLACNPTPSYPELGCTPECCKDSPATQCTSFWYSDRFARMHGSVREKLLRKIPLQKGAVVVDVGAGSGSAEPILSELVGPKGVVIATELNPATYRKLAAYVATQKLTNVVLKAVKHPYDTAIESERKNSIDAVIFVNSMTFFHKPSSRERDLAYLRVFLDHLKPGGMLAYHQVYIHGTTLNAVDARTLFLEAGFVDHSVAPPSLSDTEPTTCFCNQEMPTRLEKGYTLFLTKPLQHQATSR